MLWHQRSFGVWLLATAQNSFGSALSAAAVSFLVLEQTGDGAALALTLALGFLPALLLPLVGVWTDRLPLQWPLVSAAVLGGAVQLALAGAALNLSALGWTAIPAGWLFAAALIGGLASVWAQPAAQSAVPLLVGADGLSWANGLLTGTRQTATLLGFLAGGGLVALAGALAALLVDGLTYLIAALLTGLLVKFPPRPSRLPAASPLAELRAGVQTLWQTRSLRLLPWLLLALNAAGAPLEVLIPAEMERLGAGAAGYSGFLTAQMLGSLLAGAGTAWAGQHLPARAAVLGWGLGAVGLLLLAGLPAAIGTAVPLAWAAAALFGFGMALSNVLIMTLVGQSVPSEQLGRVFGVLGSVSMLGMPLTLLALAAWVGRVPAPGTSFWHWRLLWCCALLPYGAPLPALGGRREQVPELPLGSLGPARCTCFTPPAAPRRIRQR
ncbi:MFS transporter [Deinococcus sp. Marseille-Q6407]|uniref:MFS transporter n=1 Tax=Deinococcus sp. Marseille-Q6407 TaxID=2969223 RepID=UPI0021C05CDF|nr:MFS transporter [Deinococcus sp. Marseille-Q6407]